MNGELDVTYCRDGAVGNRRFFARLFKVNRYGCELFITISHLRYGFADSLRLICFYPYLKIPPYKYERSVIIVFNRLLSLPKIFCLSVSRAFLSRKALGMAFRQSLKYFSLIRFELNCTAGTDDVFDNQSSKIRETMFP